MSLFPLRRGRGRRRSRRRVVVGAERLERRLALSASVDPTWTNAETAIAAKARAIAAPVAPEPVDAPRWVVRLAPGADPVAAAAAAGAAASKPTGLLPDTFIWEFPAPQAAAFGRTVAAAARELPGDVASAYPLVARQQSKKLVPNDPLFANQWHLRNTGQGGGVAGEDANVSGVWDAYLGSGVVIGIVDDGLQHAHPDLAPNYVSAFSYDFNDDDTNPTPVSTDGHGTSAAGVAAARGDNAIGVSGAAPEASLAGLRLIAAPTDDAQEADCLTWFLDDIDIYSNSWGPSDTGDQLAAPGPLTLAALEQGVQTGRGGLGSIYVWAAGNGLGNDDNVNYDGYANSRYTIAVTAITDSGDQAWYAEPGAAILIAAPSNGGARGITTTDLIGTSGYNTSTTANGGDYTNAFGGTSSATPLVSGVVALMLEANPDLTWRDVQHVLVDSARRNDPTDADWTQNGSGRWVNHKYGFGAIDAAAAVELAETWNTVAPEMKVSSGTQFVDLVIPDDDAVGLTSSYTVSSGISTEWVEVTFAATHPYRGDLEVVLTSPSGTSSILAEARNDSNNDYTNWKFTSARNWGESSAGTWTLTVRDLGAADVGTWTSWSLDVYGTDSLPTVTIGRTGTDVLMIGDTDTITFALSEAATDFTVDDVTVVGGSISGFSGTGTSYSATFTPAASFNGPATVSIAAGAFTGATGNGSVAASLDVPVDTAPPTVAITRAGTGTLRIGTTDTITFTLSEPAADFAVDDVTVMGGALTAFAGSGSVYTATFTPVAAFTGNASVSIAAGTFTDGVGYANLAGGPLSILVDTVAPTVTIARTGTGTLRIGTTDMITFTLSEPASDFTGGDVTVTGGALSAFTGSGLTYSATFTPDTAFTGTAKVSVAAGTFTDGNGNGSLAGGPLDIPVDTAAPAIVAFTSPTPVTTVGIGGSVVIDAEFSEPVTPGGTVTVELTTGVSLQLVVDATGLFASGTYTVQPGEVAQDLDVVAVLPDGSISDAVGNTLDATLPVSGSRLADRCDIVVDGAVKIVDSGDFSTNAGLVWDVKSRYRQIPIRFSTPVTGVTARSFIVYQNQAPISLRGATVSGSGTAYTLVLPVSRARPFGLYRLDIAPDSGILATANGAAASPASSIHWGHGHSVGVLPDAPIDLTVTPSAPSKGRYAVALAWTAPPGNAGGAVTEYVVEYRLVGSKTWLRVRRPFPAGTSGTVITGLAAGRAYEFRVAARNAFGLGAYAIGIAPLSLRSRRV